MNKERLFNQPNPYENPANINNYYQTELNNGPFYNYLYPKNQFQFIESNLFKIEENSLYCEICAQSFRTPVSFNRHEKSRKHEMKLNKFKCGKRSKQMKVQNSNSASNTLSLLPDKVIESIIDDLALNHINKDSYFADIDTELVHGANDVIAWEPVELPSFSRIFSNIGTHMEQSPSRLRPYNCSRLKVYPCSLCFKTLHSQELFDQHLKKNHFKNIVQTNKMI